MKARLARWESDLISRFPDEVVREYGLAEGQEVDLAPGKHVVELTPRRRIGGLTVYRIEEMIAEAKRLGPEYEPETADWGPDRGSEIIDDHDPR